MVYRRDCSPNSPLNKDPTELVKLLDIGSPPFIALNTNQIMGFYPASDKTGSPQGETALTSVGLKQLFQLSLDPEAGNEMAALVNIQYD